VGREIVKLVYWLLGGSGTVRAGGPSHPGARRERIYDGAVGSCVGYGRLWTIGTMEIPDPIATPRMSIFGLLSRLGICNKEIQYKPSTANLKEHLQWEGAISAMNGGIHQYYANDDVKGRNMYMIINSNMKMNMDMKERSLHVAIQ
jgi:hypothetical protein